MKGSPLIGSDERLSQLSFLPDVGVDGLRLSLNGERYLTFALAPAWLHAIQQELRLESLRSCAEHLTNLPKGTVLTCFGQRAGADSQTFIAPAHVEQVVSRGFTVVVENAQVLSPTIATMAQEFCEVLGYATGPGGVALSISPVGDAVPLHFDGIETLSFQLNGKKTWRIGRASEVQHPDTSVFLAERHSGRRDHSIAAADYIPQRLPSSEDLQRLDLEPGDGLALGRGWWHTTSVPEDGAHSCGLIFKMPTPSAAAHLALTVGQLLSQQARFRRPLIGLWSEDADARQLAEQAWLADLDQMLATITEQLRPSTPARPTPGA